MNSNQCVMCIAPDVEYINSKVAKHDMTDSDAAKHYKVTDRVWAAHYESHVLRKLVNALSTDIVPLKEIVIDKIKVVGESVDRLRKVVLILTDDVLLNRDKRDSKDVLALGQMERNLTQTVKDLAQIQGELNVGDTVNIQYNIVKAEKFMNIVMETASPEYKKVLLQKLKNVNLAD